MKKNVQNALWMIGEKIEFVCEKKLYSLKNKFILSITKAKYVYENLQKQFLVVSMWYDVDMRNHGFEQIFEDWNQMEREAFLDRLSRIGSPFSSNVTTYSQSL